ncbi:MAG: UDP-N-acetylglucosamine 1-carboxyvinyltransferase [Bacilli bacterium]|nr:UDP-N-acetylglucosamine 1-carboxyvinyltransferase [Bacilli bacterium]
MKALKIIGGNKLNGTVKVSGAKNSAVALIPAALLCDEVVKFSNVPNISDMDALKDIIEYLNGSYKNKDNEYIYVASNELVNKEIPAELASKLRASYYFMGALLGKCHKVEIYLPGGCTIGARPIDLHLKGFEALGATVEMKGDKILITADKLVGANVYLDFASVGATINIMLAAVKAKGVTIIENAAREPEIVNVANFLNLMGAKVSGAGTDTIKIKGVEYLHSCHQDVIPDRIEAATYIMMGALLSEHLVVENVIPEHLHTLIQKLEEMGVDLKIEEDKIHVTNKNKLKAVKVRTLVYPGFPTDMQQIIATLMTQAQGESKIVETIFENRFLNLLELEKMGANVSIQGNKGFIYGPTKLHGAAITASDLRAGAGLVFAGLIADGETILTNIQYILRGYEDIVGKLQNLGAKIELIEI